MNRPEKHGAGDDADLPDAAKSVRDNGERILAAADALHIGTLTPRQAGIAVLLGLVGAGLDILGDAVDGQEAIDGQRKRIESALQSAGKAGATAVEALRTGDLTAAAQSLGVGFDDILANVGAVKVLDLYLARQEPAWPPLQQAEFRFIGLAVASVGGLASGDVDPILYALAAWELVKCLRLRGKRIEDLIANGEALITASDDAAARLAAAIVGGRAFAPVGSRVAADRHAFRVDDGAIHQSILDQMED